MSYQHSCESESQAAETQQVVRVISNSHHPVKVLWFEWHPRGSMGMNFADYLRVKNDKLGESLFDSGTLVLG